MLPEMNPCQLASFTDLSYSALTYNHHALTSLKKCGVQTCDLITVYCSLRRPVIEYASAVLANLPKYLSDALEGIQKRALRIILPNLHYDEALILSGLRP